MTDFLSDLESMVANVEFANSHNEIDLQDIERWRSLFRLSDAQAKHEIESWRSKIDRLHVSNDHWEMVRHEKEFEGYDREAYEYAIWLTTSGRGRSTANTTNSTSANTSYILKLDGPLDSAEKVQAVACLVDLPRIAIGVGEYGDAAFCTIDGLARQKILDWIAVSHPAFLPTIVRLSQSPKSLSDDLVSPKLGFDATLPHHRPNDDDFTPQPAQDQYPVWYFFYGNLAKADELQRRLDLPEPAEYTPASIRGGQIRSWRGQYRALVDNATGHEHGSAYLITSQEHEDILRFYETEKYEVVRCDIEMEDRVQKGLVFRFAGGEDELE